ncbi:MAG: hypothetical protein ACHQJ6_03500, partial [Candidatus Berkiellales bacterium]
YIEEWFELMEYYENNWFKPILKALQQGKLNKVIISSSSEFTITKTLLKYFWRKRSLPQIAKQSYHNNEKTNTPA